MTQEEKYKLLDDPCILINYGPNYKGIKKVYYVEVGNISQKEIDESINKLVKTLIRGRF